MPRLLAAIRRRFGMSIGSKLLLSECIDPKIRDWDSLLGMRLIRKRTRFSRDGSYETA